MNIKNLLNNYLEAKKVLDKELSENGKEGLKNIFKELFAKHEGLKVVAVKGWTPDFNDGESCEHDQTWYVGKEEGYFSEYPDFAYDDMKELYEAFGYDEDAVEKSKAHVNNKCDTLLQVIEDLRAIDYIIQRLFVTNFIVIIKLQEDGSILIEDDFYDCGY